MRARPTDPFSGPAWDRYAAGVIARTRARREDLLIAILNRTLTRTNRTEMTLHYQSQKRIARERARQIEKHDYDHEHDDKHTRGQLAAAAATFAMQARLIQAGHHPSEARRRSLGCWPFTNTELKENADVESLLVKAGALVFAELERLARIRDRSNTRPDGYVQATGSMTARERMKAGLAPAPDLEPIPDWIAHETRMTWRAVSTAESQSEAYRIIERFCDRIGWGRDTPRHAAVEAAMERHEEKRLAELRGQIPIEPEGPGPSPAPQMETVDPQQAAPVTGSQAQQDADTLVAGIKADGYREGWKQAIESAKPEIERAHDRGYQKGRAESNDDAHKTGYQAGRRSVPLAEERVKAYERGFDAGKYAARAELLERWLAEMKRSMERVLADPDDFSTPGSGIPDQDGSYNSDGGK